MLFLLLIAFRLLNAAALRTFFQPDEFFQSLEPAWHLAFGDNAGAWITWEWRHHLRSSLHPLLFAAVYSVADSLAQFLDLVPATRAELLIAAPKTTQAIIAAVGDFYTWKLARRVYGDGKEARAALALTVLSPWQWFCSTRTLSNCLETTITIVALYLWPWEWSLGSATEDEPKRTTRRTRGRKQDDDGGLTRLRQCLALAALACILRPTNILIWMSLASVALFRSSWAQRATLVREVVVCGSAVLALSALADRLFYGGWTFPPLKFLYFNIAQSLAVFYGRNDWHYYISQGYPLLLTTALPFTLVGLYRALTKPSSKLNRLQTTMQTQLASICIIMPFTLSLISHKEVRFIYPLLPSLHILTAPQLVNYFLPATARSSGVHTPRRLTLLFLLLANIVIALYTTLYHASGTLNVLSYLRDQRQIHSPKTSSENTEVPGITAGFLMPCHSTPWRSHLVHSNIDAWALSCEPPVDFSPAEKAAYVDEADQFYLNPSRFLRNNMEGGLRHFPRKPTHLSSLARNTQDPTIHNWPDYLVFFAHLEPTLQSLLRPSSYDECWRTFNTQWHDDRRRKGDIVVWCLDPAEQQSWRSESRKRSINSRETQFDRVIDRVKTELSPSGKRRQSPFQRWVSNTDWSGSWSPRLWPWEKKKRSWVDGLKVPEWMSPSTWSFAEARRKKNKVAAERALWS